MPPDALADRPLIGAPDGELEPGLAALRRGEAVVLCDPHRNCSDVIAAAERLDSQAVALMAREAGGVIAVALTPERARELALRPLPGARSSSPDRDRALPFPSIEARRGVTTGISAADRAHTIRTAALDEAGAAALVSPGHVFPVVAAGGRYGRVEAALDAVRAAGLRPAAAICDLLDGAGEVGDCDAAARFGDSLGLALITTEDLLRLRVTSCASGAGEDPPAEVWERPLSAVTERAYRDVMGRFPTGVTVVTTCERERRYGTTATAVASVSLEPPTLLVCMNRDSATGAAISRTRCFALNILEQSQEAIARVFATKAPDKFAGVSTRLGLYGEPLLRGAVGYLECRVTRQTEAATHTIFLGEVERAGALAGAPMTCYRSSFGPLLSGAGRE